MMHRPTRQVSDARVGVSLLVFAQAPSLSASALSLAKAFPPLLLKMLILPRRFEKLVLCVAHAAGELCLQVHNHLLHLLGMRTLELFQVIEQYMRTCSVRLLAPPQPSTGRRNDCLFTKGGSKNQQINQINVTVLQDYKPSLFQPCSSCPAPPALPAPPSAAK